MYQHPQALHLNADYLQRELLHDAEAHRLARGSQSYDENERFDVRSFQRRLVAVAVALVTVLGVIALI
jgi:hypothetical protein